MRNSVWLIAALVVVGFAGKPVQGADEAIDFERQVRPIFAVHCVKCHGPDEASGGLRLDRGGDALAGGDSGQTIVPGKAAQSFLLERVQAKDEAERMPPEGEPLSAEQIAVLARWIDAGAPWPGAERRIDSRLAHWSLQPIVRPAVPAVGEEHLSAIDRFIRARLAERGLAPSPPADPRTLVRRVYYDLVGLPPTPREIDAYLAAAREHDDDQAYAELIERLLASPRHGERWAQHWLDAVRFAESDGFETNKPRANAWPYRDYVIESFTSDKPYDQFVREQLAGDVLGADAATGFLVGGANDVVLSPDPVLTAQQRADVLHDMVSTTASTFLGLTVGCARCHNHKFDPIPQADYYGLKAVFAGVSHGERPRTLPESAERQEQLAANRARLEQIEAELVRFEPLAQVIDGAAASEKAAATAAAAAPLRSAVHPKVNVDRFSPIAAKRLRFTVQKTNNLEPCIDELEVFAAGGEGPTKHDAATNVALASRGTTATASSVYPNSSIHRLEHINDGLLGNGRSWISREMGGGWVELEFPEIVTIDAVRWGRDREEKYRDRLAIEYTIAVSTTGGEASAGDEGWSVVATSRDRQPFAEGKEPAAAFDHLPPAERSAAEVLAAERREIEAKIAELSAQPMLYAGVFNANPPATHRLHRGDPMQPREEILPAALSAVAVPFAPEAAEFGRVGSAHQSPPKDLTASREVGIAHPTEDQRRRQALADWIVDPANPLTARVIVNRLWQHHFGEGLVATPSDFGANGARPTHPELLDWLAAELVEHDWSLRHIHRLIVTSATYRQASTFRPEPAAIDAQAKLLWRYPPQRLSAEQIRDTLLAASGKLDVTAGGPGFLPFEPNSNYVRVYDPKQSFGPADFRRMIYMTKIRMHQEATFGAFDCPDGGQIAPRRSQSTTPLQALNLLNGPFVAEQAGFLAERIAAEAGEIPQSQVKHAFRLVLLREASEEELSAGEQLVREHGLASFCRAIFNANELLYVY
jgi:mono/diheme cytochrome c family protein